MNNIPETTSATDLQSSYLGRRRQRPLTCLADVGELERPPASMFDKVMPADYETRFMPRKWWEWDYIAQCAEQLGLMSESGTALGLGVGAEPLIFYFAQHFGSVIATDLYSADTVWKEARFGNSEVILNQSPIAFPRQRVSIRNADMRSTGVPDLSVDVVWSCSSIEHIPTLRDLFLVFKEIDRVLKPGGHAILTTEYCVTSNTYLLPGVNAWSADILSIVKDCLPGFEWLGATDLAFNATHPGNAARPRRYLPLSSIGSTPFLQYRRSGTLAVPVGLSVVVPIAFVIRKQSERGVPAWEDIALPDWMREYSDGLWNFFDGNYVSARDKLENVMRSRPSDIQSSHIAFRFAIDARARLGELEERKAFLDRILDFLDTVPPSPVQDADCLDMCCYFLGECGDIAKALDTYELCLYSPSTGKEHLFQLLIRYLSLAGKHGAADRAVRVAADILSDMIPFGLREAELKPFLKSAEKTVSPAILKRVNQEMRRIGEAWKRNML